MKLVLTAEFPQAPPKGVLLRRLSSLWALNDAAAGFFVTRIFHPNVSSTGEICVNTLKKDWKPEHGLEHVLLVRNSHSLARVVLIRRQVIRCLLIYPNPESALNPEAGRLLLENYDDYARRAAMMTRIHAPAATPGPRRKVLDESSGSEAKVRASPAKKLKVKKTARTAKKKSLRRL